MKEIVQLSSILSTIIVLYVYLFMYSEFFICWVEVSTPLFNSLHKMNFANIKNIKNHLITIFFSAGWKQ